MLEYVGFPVIISIDKYEFNKNDYLDYFVVKKNKNSVVLFSNLQNKNTKYWLVNEIGEKIKNLYGDMIFIFIEKKDNNIEIFTGSTFDYNSLETSYFKSEFTLSEIEKKQKQFKKKLLLLEKFFNCDNIGIFCSEKEIDVAKILFSDFNYKIYNPKDVLKKTKIHTSYKNKIMPFFVVSLIYVFLLYISNVFIDNYYDNILSKNKKVEKDLLSKIKFEQNRKKKFKKKLKTISDLKNDIIDLQGKVYGE